MGGGNRERNTRKDQFAEKDQMRKLWGQHQVTVWRTKQTCSSLTSAPLGCHTLPVYELIELPNLLSLH